jgi:hypothetical protein
VSHLYDSIEENSGFEANVRTISSIGPPNKIQARALPFMLRGSDIIAQAPPTQERIIT